MPASILSLLRRPFRAMARRLPSSEPTLSWAIEAGVSAAVWTAPEADPDAGTVSSVRFEIRPNGTARQPFALIVSPEGYMPLTFSVGDLEKARELALRQLAIAGHLAAVQPAAASSPAIPAPFEAAETGMFRPATDATAETHAGGRDEAA